MYKIKLIKYSKFLSEKYLTVYNNTDKIRVWVEIYIILNKNIFKLNIEKLIERGVRLWETL